MRVLLITRLLRGFGSWARKPINHTSSVDLVTPIDRLKSVRNSCVIEFFVALFVLSLCPFDISVGVGTESDLFPLFFLCNCRIRHSNHFVVE